MSSKKISVEQKQELQHKAKKEISRLENLLSEKDTLQLLDKFKNKYNICETIYKIFLEEHQKFNNTKVQKYSKVTMRQVPHALKFAGYNFEKQKLNKLFGSNDESGTTIKKLRDSITHGIDEKAVKEIAERQQELFECMDNFLTTIQNYVIE